MSKASTSDCSSLNIPCLCPEGSFSSIETFRTPKNLGWHFVKCRKANFTSVECGIWCWLDEVRICDCGKGPCKVIKSNKDQSKERRFYCCPRSIDNTLVVAIFLGLMNRIVGYLQQRKCQWKLQPPEGARQKQKIKRASLKLKIYVSS